MLDSGTRELGNGDRASRPALECQHSLESSVELAAGARVGPYEVAGLIGAGGMGEVYRARDHRLGRDVALKVLPSSVASDADRLRRFEIEAQGSGRPQPSQHPRRLRHRQRRRPVVLRLGVARRREPAHASRGDGPPDAQGPRLCDPDRPRPRRRARQGDRPPRPEARERLRHPGRAGQDPRLRPGQAHPLRGFAGLEPGPHAFTGQRGHDARDPDGHGGLHVSRAGAPAARGLPLRHLLLRGDPLRDALGAAGLPGRDADRHDARDLARGPARVVSHPEEHLSGRHARRPPLSREEPRRALPVGARSRFRPPGDHRDLRSACRRRPPGSLGASACVLRWPPDSCSGLPPRPFSSAE